jgi:hypothetical protein
MPTEAAPGPKSPATASGKPFWRSAMIDATVVAKLYSTKSGDSLNQRGLEL